MHQHEFDEEELKRAKINHSPLPPHVVQPTSDTPQEPPIASGPAGRSDNPQILFSWKAPLRPFIKRSPRITRFYLALTLLLSLIVAFFGDFILLIPIWTILFLFYVLTITPPPEVEHKITQFGIDTAGLKIRWEALSHYHFDKRFGYDMLTIVSQPPYFDHFYMVVPGEEVKKKLMTLLAGHIVYEEEPRKSVVDRMVHLMSRLVPQEETT